MKPLVFLSSVGHNCATFLWPDDLRYFVGYRSADCIHSGIDFGPLNAGAFRTVQGKFYWIEGTKDDLLASWQKDFGEG